MSKFDDVINVFSDILLEYPNNQVQQTKPVQPTQQQPAQQQTQQPAPQANVEPTEPEQPAQPDYSTITDADGDHIRAGLAEVLGDEAQADEIMQGLINSKSISGSGSQPVAPAPAVA